MCGVQRAGVWVWGLRRGGHGGGSRGISAGAGAANFLLSFAKQARRSLGMKRTRMLPTASWFITATMGPAGACAPAPAAPAPTPLSAAAGVPRIASRRLQGGADRAAGRLRQAAAQAVEGERLRWLAGGRA